MQETNHQHAASSHEERVCFLHAAGMVSRPVSGQEDNPMFEYCRACRGIRPEGAEPCRRGAVRQDVSERAFETGQQGSRTLGHFGEWGVFRYWRRWYGNW